MDDVNREPMVTIPLREYNELRDRSNENLRLLERMNFIDNRIHSIDTILGDLDRRKADK